jgi:hypothetical protein
VTGIVVSTLWLIESLSALSVPKGPTQISAWSESAFHRKQTRQPLPPEISMHPCTALHKERGLNLAGSEDVKA